MDKKIQGALLFILAIFIFMIGTKYGDFILNYGQSAQNEINMNTTNTEPTKDISKSKEDYQQIFVHITGAVKNPGIYRLMSNARVNDAVQMAEALPKADLNALNLAAKLNDGEKVVVPLKDEKNKLQVQEVGTTTGKTLGRGSNSASNEGDTSLTSGSNASANVMAGNQNVVNINTASAAELDTLPGIGATYAQRIIQYRNEHGPFQKIEEIQDVKGIGPKKFEKLKESISVN